MDSIAVKAHTTQLLALVREVRGQMDFTAFLDNDSDAKKKKVKYLIKVDTHAATLAI